MAGVLVLSRRLREGIVIFNDDNEVVVELWVNEISGGQSKIAIRAPRSWKILRDELVQFGTADHEIAKLIKERIDGSKN